MPARPQGHRIRPVPLYQPPSCCLPQPAHPSLPPECPELLLAQTCPQTPRALFAPSIPCSSPSLSPPHSFPFSPRISHLLPVRISESALLYMGVFRALLQPLAAVPRITYPHLSHSNLPTASRERQGFERSRPRRMMNHSRQGQVWPE